MIGAMRQESATVDETSYLGAGFCYFQTDSYRFMVGHPVLSQIIASYPIRFFNLHETPSLTALKDGKVLMPYACRWSGAVGSTQELFPNGPDFYHWPPPESQWFGQYLIYDPANDAETVLFWTRFTQVLVTLAVGLVVFFWTKQLAGATAGLLATILWIANPVVLGYGHLVLSDMSVTLLLTVTVCLYARFLQQPSLVWAVVVGASVGLSLTMKFTALSLVPIFVVVTAFYWWYERRGKPATMYWGRRQFGWHVIAISVSAWAVVLLVYFPHWSPAPAISAERAAALGVPGWFQTLRPILLPRDFFKELAVMVAHIREGGDSYLLGKWTRTGWWYYYVFGMAFKSPIPLLVLVLGGGIRACRLWWKCLFGELVPWVAAGVYLCFSMTSKINIGIRHVLPVYALLAVAAASQLVSLRQRWRVGVGILCAWLWLASVFAYPFYIQYFNELVGGPADGYKYLIDSNFDWGQDAKRLKAFLDEHGIRHIYLDYFGTQAAIAYYKIPNTRVNGQQAHQISEGYLVVSASQLVRPEWAWLREAHQPVARVAYTTFVYRFP